MSVITGSRAFEGLAEKYGIPFVVAGFEGEQILAAIAALVKLRGVGKTVNMYTSAVTREGNLIEPDDTEIVEIARSYGVAPILLISTLSEEGCLAGDGSDTRFRNGTA